MGNLHEEIAVTQIWTFFQTPSPNVPGGTIYTDQLRAIEADASARGVTDDAGNSFFLLDPIDYKRGHHRDWTRTPSLFFFVEESHPPHGGGGIRASIREVGVVVGIAYTGSTGFEDAELAMLRYIAAIRGTVMTDFQLGSSSPRYVAGCVEVEADRVLEISDHSTTRKSRYVKFVLTVQDST